MVVADFAGDGRNATSSIPVGAVLRMHFAIEFGADFELERETDRTFLFEGR